MASLSRVWRCGLGLALLVGICPAVRGVELATLQAWGMEVAQEIESTLRLERSSLYAETANLGGGQYGGANGRAFVWPAATQFRVLDSLVQIDPTTYAPELRAFSNQLRNDYWRNGGYSAVAFASDHYYDDNGHLVVSMVEAYNLTGDEVYKTRAIETYDFVLSGEDDAGGGGIYFRRGDYGSKDTVSTLQGARAAAMLYNATGEQQYLDDAERLMEWTNSHVQQAGGRYWQRFRLDTMQADGVDIVNATGIGISANIELYDATGDLAYLHEAQRVAYSGVGRFFNSSTGALNDESYWAFEMVDALNDLYLRDGNRSWRSAVHGAMEWMHDNKRDPNGHYPLFWGREGVQTETLTEWNLNEQAAAARALLDTSVTELLPGDFNDDGVVDMADYVVWRNNVGAHRGTLPNDTSQQVVGTTQYLAWKRNFGATDSSAPSSLAAAAVPEPATLLLWVAAIALLTCGRRPA
ncbi:glycoside hydrolase family 76 protein [Aeoliella sp. ICT_H6.2]|uniref:Glycoside hydrolase family 76 protein n=1 Tax=Aeoliella straminimaris TaxID=2954799 RepID=A0A9X2FJC7_9BACT|nr:glycoside hydrolase family 76 protein [Aeoliella straminimaris]MCO6048126.1 glycoside hydrolase family 76 protein [Aeoliella straminimaris]